jgi:kynurenine formamidase
MMASGEDAPKKGMGFANEWIGMKFHGYYYTHLDSLAHVFWNGMMYNGRPSTNITLSEGGKDGSVEWASGGIVSRGVLLDIPRLQNKEWLEPGEAVTPEHLNACEKSEGLTVGPGDILIIRNGRDARNAKKGVILPEKHGSPGLHASCLPWLREREIAVLCSDFQQEVLPSGFAVAMPIHAVGMAAMGLWLVDNATLEELAAVCSEENRWEFQFIISALPLKNTTGSPVNPIAMF